MKAHDLIELAARNLRESVLRNSLTTLGISVGVASLVAMLSLGIGLQELASRRLTRSGLFDMVVVYSRREAREFSREERRATPGGAESRPLDDQAREEITRIPHVLEVHSDVRFPTEVRFEGKAHFTMVAGIPPSAKSSDAFDAMKGNFFSGPAADEAILQILFAKDLSNQPESLIGKEIVLFYAERQTLPGSDKATSSAPKVSPGSDPDFSNMGFSVVRREKKLRIVGLIETQPYGGMTNFGSGRLFLPIDVAESLRTVQVSNVRDLMRENPSLRTFPALTARVDSAANVKSVQDEVKKKGFTTFSLLDASRNLARVFAIFDLFLGIFGSLALAVASLGIVNTLVMAILERRREIGILKALGAGNGDVKRLFFAEAGAMGLVGGVLGVTLGWSIGRVINFGTRLYMQRQELPAEDIWFVPWWLICGAIGFSVVVSLVSGLYPASRAAKLDPVQALRYE